MKFTCKILFSSPLPTDAVDYETINQYTLTVTVSDTPGKSVIIPITVTITAINEGPPVFAGPYTATVAENAVSGALVRSVAATDVDGDVNPHGHRTYSVLSGNTGSKFTLDPTTGSVNVGAALDRETTASYMLVIQAVEECGENSASTTLTITISDIDDNAPTCTVLIFSVQVRRDSLVFIYYVWSLKSQLDIPGLQL